MAADRADGQHTTKAGAPVEAKTFASGRFVVQRLLGEGGQKTVYLARDTQLDRDVAIAAIKSHGLDEAGIARVRREAQTLAGLGAQAHIVTIHDIGQEQAPDGRLAPYLVCEYIAGGDLERELRRAGGPLPLERVVAIGQDLCRALDVAHSRGILHRDIKPGNVWLTEEGHAKLGDFGLAVALGQSRLTQAGTIMGTASYMPPEQALGTEVDQRSDLYALGCVLYEMVTGRPPFLGDDMIAVVSQHINTAPVAASWHRADLPRALDALIERLLEKSPDERPQSAQAVLDALAAIAAAGVHAGAETAPPEPRRDLAGVEWGRFVGRREEMDGLKDALNGALSGKAALIFVAGEPGIGKTRLAEEFAVYAGLRGAQVLSGRGYEGESSLPYTPFIEGLRQYTRSRPDDELRAQLGPGAPEIATLVSEIRTRFPDIEEAPKLDGEAERLRLFESVTEFLHDAATANPVVLFLDDLHWADKASLLLLQHLAQRTAGDRLLILGAYRDMELDRTHPLSETLGALRRLPNYRRVLLRGLPQESVIDLLTAIDPSEGGAAGRQALAEALYQETEGNPFFMREVLSHLIEEGKIVREGGRWVASVTTVTDLGIPEGIKEVIGRRLSRLSEGCNRMLTLASTMAGGFSWEALKAISADVPEAELLDLLEETLAAQLIAERKREGAGTYDFTHALIRQTLYEELSTPRRVLLHRQIGEALEQLYTANVEPHLAELAHHFYQAAPGGDVEKAIAYARRAGDRAMLQVAWEPAAAHYERALQAMELIPSPDEQVRLDILLALGRALEMGGADRSRWRPVFQRAVQLASSAGDSERYARAALGFAAVWPTLGVVDADAVRLLDGALQLLGPAESTLRAMVLARLGNELAISEERDRAKRLVAEAHQMARRIDDPETLAYVLRYVALGEVDAARALSIARERIEAATRSGDKLALLGAHADSVPCVLALGDRAGFDRAVEEGERLRRELRFGTRVGGWHRALQARMDGRFDEAERLARQTFAEHANPALAAQFLGMVIGGLRDHQGRLLEMEPEIKANAERYPALPMYRAALAWVYSSDVHRREDARAVFDELAEGGFGRHLPSDAALPMALSFLADVCWSLGDAGRAPELYEMLSPREGECLVVGWAVDTWGAVSRSLALLAATMRRWEDTERHFEDALRTNAQLGDKPWLAQTRAQYGAVLLTRGAPGDRERAVALLQDALDAAQEMGMKKVVEDCLALKVRAQGTEPASP